jgi:hypothetical protein
MNPYVQSNLADAQSALASGKTGLVDTAWERAQISKNFAGAMVMVSNALKTRLSSTTADRAGAVASVGASTYVAHKDTMIQTINVDGFTGTPVIKAGEIVEVTGKYQLSLATREPFLDGAGNEGQVARCCDRGLCGVRHPVLARSLSLALRSTRPMVNTTRWMRLSLTAT